MPAISREHAYSMVPVGGHTEKVRGRVGVAKFQSAQRLLGRHLPRCQGTGQGFRVWCGQAIAERLSGSLCACRSESPWYVASSVFRRLTGQARPLRSSDARSAHTGVSRREVNSQPDSERGTDHSVDEPYPTRPPLLISSVPLARIELAAASSFGLSWPEGELGSRW